jgi:hypothetical protein
MSTYLYLFSYLTANRDSYHFGPQFETFSVPQIGKMLSSGQIEFDDLVRRKSNLAFTVNKECAFTITGNRQNPNAHLRTLTGAFSGGCILFGWSALVRWSTLA